LQGGRGLYIRARPLYFTATETLSKKADMRAEIENVVDEIKQAISLLRRHL
jgi:hypothetical protein